MPIYAIKKESALKAWQALRNEEVVESIVLAVSEQSHSHENINHAITCWNCGELRQ